MISLSILSDINEFPTEKRYDAGTKISELKKKLELVTGADHSRMKLNLAIDDQEAKEIDSDEKTLGDYIGDPSGHIFKLTVRDTSGANPLEGDVPKFTIPEDKYLSRPGNARQFIEQMREKHNTSQ